jgi:2,4-dienoyl-CoA reductase-like NADH-dependent reductase (Old Yellow Enzyme family)
MTLKKDVGRFDVEDGYNLGLAQAIRPALGDVPLFSVGGLRRASHMEAVLEEGEADLISMSRPFLREPYLVKQIREGKTEVAACDSCNLCIAAQLCDMETRCYTKGLPGQQQA